MTGSKREPFHGMCILCSLLKLFVCLLQNRRLRRANRGWRAACLGTEVVSAIFCNLLAINHIHKRITGFFVAFCQVAII